MLILQKQPRVLRQGAPCLVLVYLNPQELSGVVPITATPYIRGRAKPHMQVAVSFWLTVLAAARMDPHVPFGRPGEPMEHPADQILRLDPVVNLDDRPSQQMKHRNTFAIRHHLLDPLEL